MYMPPRPRSMIAEAYDFRRPMGLELEARARRMRSAAMAAYARRGAGLLLRGWELLMTPPTVRGPGAPLSLAQLEADARYVRASAIADAVLALAALPNRLLNRIRARLDYERSVEDLYAMDDRSLRDLGLGRSDIPAALAGEIYRPERPVAAPVLSDDVANENLGFRLKAVEKRGVA